MSVKGATKESTGKGLLYLFDPGSTDDETHK